MITFRLTILFFVFVLFILFSNAVHSQKAFVPSEAADLQTKGESRRLTVKTGWVAKGAYRSEGEYSADYDFQFRQQYESDLTLWKTKGYDPLQGEFVELRSSWSEKEPLILDSYKGGITEFHKKDPPRRYSMEYIKILPSGQLEGAAGKIFGMLGTGMFEKDSTFGIAGCTDHIIGSHPVLWSRETTIAEASGSFNTDLDLIKLFQKGYVVKELTSHKSSHGSSQQENGVLHVFLSEWCENSKFVEGKDFIYKKLVYPNGSEYSGTIDDKTGTIIIHSNFRNTSKFERNVTIQHETSHKQDWVSGWRAPGKLYFEEEYRAFKRERDYFQRCKPKKGLTSLDIAPEPSDNLLYNENMEEKYREDVRLALERDYDYDFDD